MRVSELMHTPAVSCRPSTTMADAAVLMREREVGSVLVLDRAGHLTGIVTDRDLAVRGLGEGLSGDVEVEAVMSRDVATAVLGADVDSAAATMADRGVRRLPVVDEQGAPHGVVSLDDLVRHLGRTTGSLVDALLHQTSHLSSR